MASYIDSTLMKNEVVLYRSKPSWVIFLPPAFWFLVAIILFIFGPMFRFINIPAPGPIPVYAYAALVALIFSVIMGLTAYINFQTSEYGITNKRVMMKIGFIRRTSLEIFIAKIESVKIKQTVMGRILDYGSIIISGVGGSKDPFDCIPDPLEFRRRVQEQIVNISEINATHSNTAQENVI